MKRIKKIANSIYFPFFILFLVYFGIRLLCTVNFNDDLVFSQIPANGILDKLKWNYSNWSTRLVIEFVYYNLYHMPILVWRIIDSFLMTLIAYSLMRLLVARPDRRMACISCALVMLYPLLQVSNAGWISTTANYTWPIALGLYAMTYFRNILEGKKVRWWQHLGYIFALIYAGNAEQTVCILLVIYFSIIVYFIIKKNFCIPLLFHFGILIGMFLFKITGPSNEIVNAAIAKTYYQDFFSLNLVDKVANAYISTFSHFVKYASPILLMLLFLMSSIVYIKYKEWLYRAVPMLPLIICLGTAIWTNGGPTQFYSFAEFQEGFITVDNFNHLAEYLPLATYLLITFAIMISIYIIWQNTAKMILAQLIFICGVGSRMIMAFSPSIFASSTRTFTNMYFCLIALLLMLVVQQNKLTALTIQHTNKTTALKLQKFTYASIGVLAVWNLYHILIAL